MKRRVTLTFCFFVVVLVLSTPGLLSAQSKLDSLISRSYSESDAAKLAQLYEEIFEIYYNGNQDSALFYSILLLEASERSGEPEMVGWANYYLADIYYYRNLDSSLVYARKYFDISLEREDTAWIADAYSFLGYIYDKQGKHLLALENFQRSLDFYIYLNDLYYIAACYNNIGYLTTFGSDQPAGVSYFVRALNIAEEIRDTSLISDASCNIAYFYDRVQDYSSAYSYYKRALELDLAQNSPSAIAQSYANMAEINLRLGKYEEADRMLLNSKNVIPELSNPYDLASNYSSYVEYYLSAEHTDSAHLYIQLAEPIIRDNNFKVLDAYLSQQKGLLSLLLGKYRNSIRHLDISIEKFNKLNSVESFHTIYTKKAEAFAALKLFNEAFHSQLLANSIADSLKYGEVAGMLSRLEQERIHEFEMKNNQLELQLASQKVESANMRNRSNLISAGLLIVFLLLICSIIIYFLFNLRKKNTALKIQTELINQQKSDLENNLEILSAREAELKELNATKDKFFSIIAHDLKNPLSTIIGLSDLYLKDQEQQETEDIIPVMEGMNSLANAGFSLLENLLEWARSQTGRMVPAPEKYLVMNTLNELIKELKPLAESKKLTFEFRSDHSPPVLADANMVATVLRNLLHNAVKFSHPEGTIIIDFQVKDLDLLTIIEDQGVGMSDLEISKLFSIDGQILKKGTCNEQGSGLGLILCKEFVEKNDGEIWAESQTQKGSKFFFTLPLYDED